MIYSDNSCFQAMGCILFQTKSFQQELYASILIQFDGCEDFMTSLSSTMPKVEV